MTLNEAINHCKEVQEKCSNNECSLEHKQLAEWLTELKCYRENKVHSDGYVHIDEKDRHKFPDPKVMTMEEYISEMTDLSSNVPEFEEGYVIICASDNHIVENRIFENMDDAQKFLDDYNGQSPSLVENKYLIYRVTKDCLQYGSFPYNNQMYFIYDVEMG